jgi:diguanylate cyclase (GGDEF)-like protein
MKSREKIEQLARENERLANTDALTGLANRRAFFHHLATQFEERVAAEHPVTFIICDVDNFKLFNDSFGHATGDAVLSHVAVVIEQVLPRRAFTARIGGEEFAIRYDSRCEDSDPDDVAQRLVKAVADTPLILNGAEHRITLSVGAFVGSNHTSPEQALSSADQAMYAAKSNGRNQFVRAA